MPQKMKDVVLLGLESTPGTVASAFDLHQPFLGAGLSPNITHHLGEILSSSTWPYRTDEVPLGATARPTFIPDININTVRDLILLATKRTNGDLPSVSIAHTRMGVGHARYLGAVLASMQLEYSRGGSPDASSILQGTMEFECIKPEATTGLSAGTQGAGRRFKIQAGVFTVDGVQATKVLSYRRTITNALALGAPDANNARIFLESGDSADELIVVAQFATPAWTTLALGGTEHAASFVHGTGALNETVTETIGKARISSHQLGESDGTVTEEITIMPYHTGAAAPCVWSFGSAIGATVLGL